MSQEEGQKVYTDTETDGNHTEKGTAKDTDKNQTKGQGKEKAKDSDTDNNVLTGKDNYTDKDGDHSTDKCSRE